MPQIKEDQLIAEAYRLVEETGGTQIIWHGSCDEACRGAWTNLEPVDWDYIKSLFNTDNTDPNAQGYELEFGEQDIRLGGDGAVFPLRCYMPYTFEEFKKLLEAGEVIRFINSGTYHFHLFSFNKQACYKETQETLNTFSDFVATDY